MAHGNKLLVVFGDIEHTVRVMSVAKSGPVLRCRGRRFSFPIETIDNESYRQDLDFYESRQIFRSDYRGRILQAKDEFSERSLINDEQTTDT